MKMQVLWSWYIHSGPSVIRATVIRITWWSGQYWAKRSPEFTT